MSTATVKKGALSLGERVHMQTMFVDGLSLAEVSKKIRRNEDTVKAYYKKYMTDATKAMENYEKIANESDILPDEDSPTNTYQEVVRRLIKGGMKEGAALERLGIALSKYEDKTYTVDELYRTALNHIPMKDLMITKSKEAGRNVTIMTSAASEKLDASRAKHSSQKLKNTPSHIFSTKPEIDE